MKYLLTAACALLGSVALLAGQADDAPGLGGLGLIVIALALGILVRARRHAMDYLAALLVTVVGIAGLAYGEADDAPGVMLVAAVFILCAIVLAARTAITAQRERRHS